MPTEIYLVKVGMSMTEGVVEQWYVPDGGNVASGELLYRLETEKVNLDVDAETPGVVKHLVAEGVTMKPGDVVGYIYAAGEEVPDRPAETAIATQPPALTATDSVRVDRGADDGAGERIGQPVSASPAARRLAADLGVDVLSLRGTGPGGRIIESDVLTASAGANSRVPAQGAKARAPARAAHSSPMARKLARELGVDLAMVQGSGPGGRITKEDVEMAAASAPVTTPSTAVRADTQVPIKGMRRTIARRMHESLQSMAQLTMNMDVDMDDAVKLREQLIEEWAERGIRPTYTDLVIRAAAMALESHPLMNATFNETEMTLLGDIHVGMAVALTEGLIVPVVRNTNRLTMEQLATESGRLAAAARDNALSIDDLQGGTFTVSALGMFGVDSFTPIINSPQVGILGVNRIRDDVGWEGSAPVKKQTMRLSLTWDHRALDGAPAALFLADVKALLEAPYRLLV